MVSAGLLLAACATLAATTYSVSSCRLVVLSFISDTGNFEQSFSRNPTFFENFSEHKVSLGLFQWLRPNGSDAEWDDGACIGYQESMLDAFSELNFEIARGFGSLAVLLSVLTVLWAAVNSCIAWNLWQIIILSALLLSGTVAACMTFIFLQSDICNSTFPESSCRLDEGGLILVAGAILWCAGFLITVLFIRPLDRAVDENGLTELDKVRAREMAAAKEKRARERERKKMQEREEIGVFTKHIYEEEEGGIAVTPVTATSYSYDEADSKTPRQYRSPRQYPKEKATQSQPVSVDGSGQDDEYEVYVNTRKQRIDEILQDIQESEDTHKSSRGGMGEV